MLNSLLRGLLFLFAFVWITSPRRAIADEFIANGSFETGDLSGWTSYGFFLSSDTTAPVSGLPTVGPSAGTFYAVSDGAGPGVRYLVQTFSVPVGAQLALSFDMFANNWNGETIINPIGLDASDGPNQYATVDILAGGVSPLDMGSGVLRNLYIGSDSGLPPNPYTHYSFDLTNLLVSGGTYQLRFAEVDTELFLHMGVDDVSLGPPALNTGVSPEPSTLTLLATALAVITSISLRKPPAPTASTTDQPYSPTQCVPIPVKPLEQVYGPP